TGWDNTEEDTIGTLDRYSYTDVVGKPISSTATIGNGYKFIGWYDSAGNKVSNDMLLNDGKTISYTTTGNATYYARFRNTVTQTFVRQVKSGESWSKTTDDEVGTLSLYTHTDISGIKVSSAATAGQYYDFVGWYDSAGNEVSEDILTNEGNTISYTTARNATYYARFSKKVVTQTFIRQVWNGEEWEDTEDDTIGTLSLYTDTDEVCKSVSSAVTVENGYRFVGWYDSDGNKVSDDMLVDNGKTISYTTTGNATYYARFEKAYTLNVSKIDGDKTTPENKVPLAGAEFTLYQKDSSGDKTIVYNGESIKCTVVETAVTALTEDGTQAVAVFDDKISADHEFYLAETKAPTGYRLLDTPLKIIIDDSGNIAQINGISQDITETGINVELANYLTLHMPTSGVPFSGGWFTVAGISLLTLAAIGLFWLKINRYKQK
ncbi:MAG: SpaA isopeptide-forming pilin-related protein, partial [Oscillospiraceae bacterium]